MRVLFIAALAPLFVSVIWATSSPAAAPANANQELTRESRAALSQGLAWLAAEQGEAGHWKCQDLGLVALGSLAYLAAGEVPDHGRYGAELQSSLKFIARNAKPSGLLNIADATRDMYNHGLASFVLAQAYGTGACDAELGPALRKAIALILATQAKDGGWDYEAKAKTRGHDLSLVVMQAKALRGGRDCGIHVPAEAIEAAIQSVRGHYQPASGARFESELDQRAGEGQFSYSKGPGGETLAMAAAGVVCLQEFGQYDDWRIEKNLKVIRRAIENLPDPKPGDGSLPFDAYTTYYVAHAIYHAGGSTWDEGYAKLRNYIVRSRVVDPSGTAHWFDRGAEMPGRVSGPSSQLFGTSVACFVLAMPHRYLPILQQGELTAFKAEAGGGE